MATAPPDDFPPLARDAVLLFFAHAGPGAVDDAVRERARRWFDAVERERLERLRFAADRDLYLVAHVLARRVLGEYTGTPPGEVGFTRGAAGKPALRGGPDAPAFSLSHTQDVAVLALSAAGDLGVDVQRVDPRTAFDGLAERHLHPEERRALGRLSEGERRARFFALWTVKESVLKATGEGLAVPLDALECDLADPPGLVMRFAAISEERPEDWFVRLHEAADHPGVLTAAALRAPGARDAGRRTESRRYDARQDRLYAGSVTAVASTGE